MHVKLCVIYLNMFNFDLNIFFLLCFISIPKQSINFNVCVCVCEWSAEGGTHTHAHQCEMCIILEYKMLINNNSALVPMDHWTIGRDVH